MSEIVFKNPSAAYAWANIIAEIAVVKTYQYVNSIQTLFLKSGDQVDTQAKE